MMDKALLDDPAAYVAWQAEVGSEEAQRQLLELFKEEMDEHGPRACLPLAEKVDDLCAQLEEFAV